MSLRRGIKYLIFSLTILITVWGCGKTEAKYVFLFIGDGMGPVQINAAERYLGAMEGKPGIIPLEMSFAPYTGTITTNSSNRYITDSGAAVTALATGSKTTPQTLSMDSEHRYPLKTIAEKAKEAGMKVGIITTVDIDHATPAGFYAHEPRRSNYYQIAKAMANSDFDFFAGGEIRYADDPNSIEEENIYELARKNGLIYINSYTGFHYMEAGAGRIFFEHPDVQADHSMPYAIDQAEESITLADMVDKGITMLENPEGFFMMVEGGKIDWAGHANDAATIIREVLDFDRSIAVALEFYKEHKNETLIVITADHETGGMAMGTTYGDYYMDLSRLQWQSASMAELTREFRNIRAQLIESTSRDSVYLDKQWAFTFIKQQTGLGDESKDLSLNTYEYAMLEEAYEKSMDSIDKKNPAEYIKYGSYDPFMIEVTHMLSRKAGIGWSTFSHTAIPVPVRAFGVGAERFNGFYDNTDIPKKMEAVMLKQ